MRSVRFCEDNRESQGILSYFLGGGVGEGSTFVCLFVLKLTEGGRSEAYCNESPEYPIAGIFQQWHSFTQQNGYELQVSPPFLSKTSDKKLLPVVRWFMTLNALSSTVVFCCYCRLSFLELVCENGGPLQEYWTVMHEFYLNGQKNRTGSKEHVRSLLILCYSSLKRHLLPSLYDFSWLPVSQSHQTMLSYLSIVNPARLLLDIAQPCLF